MPSLKDMRVRIAATKATQKITKAMQMVAASKLRRAQSAAEAARPYAESMGRVLGKIAGSVSDISAAPKLLAGTGSDDVHLLLVCTGERGLCGPFNSAIVRLARERANCPHGRRQGSEILLRRPQGLRAAQANFEKQIIETVELRGVRQIGFHQRGRHRQAHPCPLRGGCLRCLHAVLLALQVGDRAAPHSSRRSFRRNPRARGERRRRAYEFEPEQDELLDELLPRNVAVQIFRALLENNASFYGAQMSAMDNATRNAGDMIRKQTLAYNRTRQA